MPRYFTLEQAERLLPVVESSILVAIARKSELQQADQSFRDLTRRIMMMGGMAVNVESAARIRQTRDRSAEKLQEVMAEIESLGCQVKDLDIGLLDFLTLYKGREVCLCWRLGETRIEFWHGLDEGFRGRKAIDEDFLSNHRGDPVS
ncbi:MAG: DUF2203 domain-containing protein [Bryobacteraceae bacterium]|nr:DUF2203 domain-containing protein [Bryobacteraceae bacterium]